MHKWRGGLDLPQTYLLYGDVKNMASKKQQIAKQQAQKDKMQQDKARRKAEETLEPYGVAWADYKQVLSSPKRLDDFIEAFLSDSMNIYAQCEMLARLVVSVEKFSDMNTTEPAEWYELEDIDFFNAVRAIALWKYIDTFRDDD